VGGGGRKVRGGGGGGGKKKEDRAQLQGRGGGKKEKGRKGGRRCGSCRTRGSVTKLKKGKTEEERGGRKVSRELESSRGLAHRGRILEKGKKRRCHISFRGGGSLYGREWGKNRACWGKESREKEKREKGRGGEGGERVLSAWIPLSAVSVSSSKKEEK